MLYIIQHNDETPAGTSLDWCLKRNRQYKIVHLVAGDKLPDPISTKDQVIICGGGMNVDEEHLYPWLKAEKDFIQMCLSREIKILGLCLGGQLIAEALGARVSQLPHWEVGWWPVQLNTLFEPTRELEVFQFHRYSFDTPKEAVSIATNSICQHQGFVYKNLTAGLQFHPESSKEWIKECANSEDYPQGPYVQGREQIYLQLHKQEALMKWYFNFLDGFFKISPEHYSP
jgi:GMP synthase-like glutamine amidotransferase